MAHEQKLIRFDGLLFILQMFLFYYNDQVLNKKILEDVQLLKKNPRDRILRGKPKEQQLRLCLVHVKYFPKMIFSSKENIFKCLIAFQKMLWKIFSSVWLFC